MSFGGDREDLTVLGDNYSKKYPGWGWQVRGWSAEDPQWPGEQNAGGPWALCQEQ